METTPVARYRCGVIIHQRQQHTHINERQYTMTEPITVPIQRDDQMAKIPGQGHPGDAGYDLTSAKSGWIAPGQRLLFGTGIKVAIPEGYVGYIKPRSGLAKDHGIDVLGGVIDAGYRGEIGVILLNTSSNSGFTVEVGDRIAQLVIQPVAAVVFEEVPFVDDTLRGFGGFGSTGVR